tara:strand:- start:4161 stop:7094 length:2934 start_codon:yes stop_codon:yes gene_type:complete
MAGVFKNLDAADVRLTPFRAHKKWYSTICYKDYYSNVLASPVSAGSLEGPSRAGVRGLYITDVSSSRLLRLNQDDNFEILNDQDLTNPNGVTAYGIGTTQQHILAGSTAGGLGALEPYTSLLVKGTPYTSSKVTTIESVSTCDDGTTKDMVFIAGTQGITSKRINHLNGNFGGTEGVIQPSSIDPNLTGSIGAVNAEGKSINDKVVAIASSGSLGSFAIAFTGSLPQALTASFSSSVSPGSAYGYAQYGVSAYGASTPAVVKKFIYCGTQDRYFALFKDGHLFVVKPDSASQLVTTGVADILIDKTNFISGSAALQDSKVHVVYHSGEVGLDLYAVGTPYNVASFDKVVDARQWVAKKPEVKATIQINQTPATIGIFAGTTGSLKESIFFTINPDTYEVSDPDHFGATKGDLQIGTALKAGVSSSDIFVGFSSSYSNRFVQFDVATEPTFSVYKADYNPIPSHPSYNPLNTLFDQGNPHFQYYEPITLNGKFQRVVHKSTNHLFYEDFYSNTKAAFGNGNINTQLRDLEDQAYVINLAQSKFGESIQPSSLEIDAYYNISGSQNESVKIVDDLFGNLYVSGGLVSPINPSLKVSGSMSINSVGEWPTRELYKYNDKGATSITESFNRGNWVMETHYKNMKFNDIAGVTLPIPQPIDLLGVVPVFSSSLSSSISIQSSVVENYKQSYNFENNDFTITFEVMPTAVSSHPSGSVIITKAGPASDIGVNENGDVFTYKSDNRTPYAITMDSGSSLLRFKRDNLFDQAEVSGSLTLNQLHHVTCQLSASKLMMYIDNVLQTTGSDITDSIGCSNKSNIYIGNSFQETRGFDGVIDNLKIYAGAMSGVDRELSYNTLGRASVIVGNVFYNQGMMVLGSIVSRYMDIKDVTARGTHTIWEKEVACTVGAGDFNRSNNPTLQEYNPTSNQYVFRPFTTGSDFKPYVTAIGLYNEHGDMLAIAKLGFPVKLPTNVDTTFIVRYDK